MRTFKGNRTILNLTIEKVTIIDTLGQELYRLFKPVLREVDVIRLPAGIYFIKSENEWGQGVFKVIKE